ncbi:MAG: protein-L-isoaspartate O-methyltransferase [Proteobacteria bacterium]|nr:protein-L-isoaspartate O-methyltransferase [Pseudomonadota bacterium]
MNYRAARTNMVESQVRTNKVTDQGVIDALLEVPRELFVPAPLRGIAYVDKDLDLGGGRHLMEPMVLARLLQTAALRAGDRVLDIGCGTGYAVALAAGLVRQVVGLEPVQPHARRARELLAELKIANAEIVEGALSSGAPGRGPFDVILLSGSVPEVPAALKGQLADGGRLLAVVKRAIGLGQATLTQRLGEIYSTRVLFDAATPLLPEFEPRESFVF